MPYISAIVLAAFITLFTGDDKPKEKIEPTWSEFDSGFEHAKKAKKKVMLDIYTDWCGWCKKLDKEVYGNSNVAKYLNEKYVLIKVNAESDKKVTFRGKTYTEAQISRALGAKGYPTIVFTKSDQELITNLGGFVDSARFLNIIKFLGEDYYETMKWEEFIEMNSKEKK